MSEPYSALEGRGQMGLTAVGNKVQQPPILIKLEEINDRLKKLTLLNQRLIENAIFNNKGGGGNDT